MVTCDSFFFRIRYEVLSSLTLPSTKTPLFSCVPQTSPLHTATSSLLGQFQIQETILASTALGQG